MHEILFLKEYSPHLSHVIIAVFKVNFGCESSIKFQIIFNEKVKHLIFPAPLLK